VIRLLRQGQTPRAVSATAKVDINPVLKLGRLIRSALKISDAMRANQSGIAAVEFALVAPVMLLMLLGLLNYGMALWTAERLQFGIEGAARCGGLGQCKDPGSIAAYAASASKGDGRGYRGHGWRMRRIGERHLSVRFDHDVSDRADELDRVLPEGRDVRGRLFEAALIVAIIAVAVLSLAILWRCGAPAF
jgi:hypothetical protein